MPQTFPNAAHSLFFQLHPVGFKADLMFQQHCGDLRRCWHTSFFPHQVIQKDKTHVLVEFFPPFSSPNLDYGSSSWALKQALCKSHSQLQSEEAVHGSSFAAWVFFKPDIPKGKQKLIASASSPPLPWRPPYSQCKAITPELLFPCVSLTKHHQFKLGEALLDSGGLILRSASDFFLFGSKITKMLWKWSFLSLQWQCSFPRKP